MKEKNGIVCAGNWILDQVKMIDAWPKKGELSNIILENRGPGGSPFNILVDYAHIGVDFPTWGMGCIGDDILGKTIIDICLKEKINTDYLSIIPNTSTSYTDVMTLEKTGERTFFHCRGANAKFSPAHVNLETLKILNPKIFHLGYLLLLDQMDSKNHDGQIAAANMLQNIQSLGVQTSIDVVTEASDRFQDVIKPCLPFVDHLIINEIEASNITHLMIRNEDGSFSQEIAQVVANKLLAMGVNKTVVIHLPEGALWAEKNGQCFFQASLKLPKNYIVGSVGAGDAFCAGVLWGLHANWPAKQTLKKASGIAAACLSAANTTDGVSSNESIEKIIQEFSH